MILHFKISFSSAKTPVYRNLVLRMRKTNIFHQYFADEIDSHDETFRNY
jgi:hypothetical protein